VTFGRVAAFVAALTMSVGNIATCAGWQATAEARMACCTTDPACPMRESEGHDHSSSGPISQAQADSCCLDATRRHDSAAAAPIFAASGVIALEPVALFSIPTAADSPDRRALAPPAPAAVPRHLLISVLLV
jgi:hypothetical protein